MLLCVFAFWVPCCDVHHDIRMKSTFSSSLLPFICRRTHVFFTWLVDVWAWWCPTHIVLCFGVVCLRLVYPMLTVSLDCPLLIAPSIFSYVYFMYVCLIPCWISLYYFYLYRIIWEPSTLGWCYQPECFWHRCWNGPVDSLFFFYDSRKWRG